MLRMFLGNSTKASDFTYLNRDDFEIALIPIHSHKPDHWSLAIFDRRYNITHFYELSQRLLPWQDALMRQAVSTLLPNESIYETPEVTQDLKKYAWDGLYNTGIHICVVARQYLGNNGNVEVDKLDFDKKRNEIYEILKKMVPEEVKSSKKSPGKSLPEKRDEEKTIKQEIGEASQEGHKHLNVNNIEENLKSVPEAPLEVWICFKCEEKIFSLKSSRNSMNNKFLKSIKFWTIVWGSMESAIFW